MQEIIFLNEQMEPEYRGKVIDYLWHSKLYEPGEFQIQVLLENGFNLNAIKYVITNNKREIGTVDRWEIDSKRPNTILLSGFFVEHELYKFVVFPGYETTVANKSVWTIADEIASTYLKFGDLGLGFDLIMPTMPSTGVIDPESLDVQYQQTGDYVGSALYSLAAAYGYGVFMTFVNSKTLKLDIANYHDRTGDSDDAEVVFSVSLNNIKNYNVVHDISDARNCAVIAGQGEGSNRISTTLYRNNGEPRRYLWVDARDIQGIPVDGGFSAYTKKLITRGKEKLAGYAAINNVEIEIQQEEAEKIGIDYDIGDIVSVVINPYNLYYKMKIIEVEDTYSQGRRVTSLIFGSKIPTPWEKVRSLYK